MLTTVFLLTLLVPNGNILETIDTPGIDNSYALYLVSSTPEGKRLNDLLAEYQALPPEGQTLFAQKLKSVQDAVQQFDQATQDYQNAVNEAKNPSNRPSDPQAARQKNKQANELGRATANLRKVATDQLSQLSAEMSAYRRHAQRSMNRNKSRESAGQQPMPMPPDTQQSFNPAFNSSPSQGFSMPQQPMRGQTPTQPYVGSGSPDVYPPQQPLPGQYDPQQYPASNYPPQSPEEAYGVNSQYPPGPQDTQAGTGKRKALQQIPSPRATAPSQKTTIGIAQFKSTVADISGPVARDLLIQALAKTSQFAIPRQKASNKIVGVEYILDGTIKEAKPTSSGKTNALTFFRAAAADDLISLEVRVFEAKTMALVDTISVKSADINTSSKFGVEDAATFLGALMKGGFSGNTGGASGNKESSSDNTQSSSSNVSEATPEREKMEQRLEPLVQEVASQIATRYGAGLAQGAPGMDFPLGLSPDDQQQQPAQNFAPAPLSQRGRR